MVKKSIKKSKKSKKKPFLITIGFGISFIILYLAFSSTIDKYLPSILLKWVVGVVGLIIFSISGGYTFKSIKNKIKKIIK